MVSPSAVMISSGSKCSESKCSESSRISSSSSSDRTMSSAWSDVAEGRESMSPNDTVERVDDGERMLPNSTDRERGRAGENMSSVESCRGGL